MTDDKQYAIREDYIDEMHNLDVKQSWRERCETCEIRDSCFVKHIAEYCSGVIDVTSIFQASSAGRKTGADSPPFDVNTGSRQPLAQGETNTPDEADIVLVPPTPLRQPYPPVKYTWEIE